MKIKLSQEAEALIDVSMHCALDLGYDHISTMHFLLADCKLNRKGTIKDFAFKSTDGFQDFYNGQRVGESYIFVNSLPLTMEAERTIRKAHKLRSVRRDKYVQPYHIFLTACQLNDTYFYSVLEPQERLYERLENYYISKGVLNRKDSSGGLWKRLCDSLFYK